MIDIFDFVKIMVKIKINTIFCQSKDYFHTIYINVNEKKMKFILIINNMTTS